MLASISYLLHPLHGDGYQFWSGIGSDFTELALIAGIVTWLRHKNCVERGCWRLGHPDPEHGQPVCRRHCDKLGACD